MHYYIEHTGPDGTRYESCGHWNSEHDARAAIEGSHTIDWIERTDIYCTA